ncbi:hypothetical protein H1R20_g8324, partial [Candolleomyces eurysporus]
MTPTSGPSSARGVSAVWPPEPIPPVGYLSRKALPIKRNDAEPLTRDDVQYDLLSYIFSNDKAVFTQPNAQGTGPEMVTFSDLYVSALYNSSKCSKVLKDKMTETPAFALELAKISLLTNVGRINTTMAFFPEMKTALRTYHPVPSLQKTDGNAQDAPRIKKLPQGRPAAFGDQGCSTLNPGGNPRKTYAWIVATTTDPLEDSDGEVDSQHVLLDYSRRLKVLKQLGEQPATPEDLENRRITRQFMP